MATRTRGIRIRVEGNMAGVLVEERVDVRR